ncbi:MAG: hypothetical protein JWQ38_598 [Flavipsychrobacter sp.]|nr:hypothetical protein [Flavipsychrobacter sp.]
MLLVFATSTVFAQKITDPKERKQMKEEFMKSCMASATEGGDEGLYEVMRVYCDCSAEKILNKLTKKEIEAMDKLTEKETEEKVMPIIQGCMDQLLKDLEKKQAK